MNLSDEKDFLLWLAAQFEIAQEELEMRIADLQQEWEALDALQKLVLKMLNEHGAS